MKCLCFFGGALLIVILISLSLYLKATEVHVKEQNPQTARIWAIQHIREKHVDVFRSIKDGSRTVLDSVEAKSQEEREFSNMIDAISQSISRMEIECTSFRPAPLANKTDELRKYEKGGEYERILSMPTFRPLAPDFNAKSQLPQYYEETDPTNGHYEYYQAIRFQSVCGSCHNNIVDNRGDNPYEIGELMRVVHVSIPRPPAQDVVKRFWAELLGVGIVTVFFLLITFYVVIRSVIMKPLRSLREVAEGISRGESGMRVRLHTGDEFEELGEAMNRMLQHLSSAQEKLRRANSELEVKINQLALSTLELSKTNQIKSDFMATMSHELRTPLNSILGFSDVLGSISTLSDKQKRYVENINNSGRALLTMINDILDMAKMESGRMEANVSSFQITRTVAAQCDMAKPLLDKKNIDLICEFEPDLPPAQQDETRIQQVLNNLLSNAIKFTPEGGRIRVIVRRIMYAPLPNSLHFRQGTSAVQKQIPMIEMKVIDTGVGISDDDQQIVFEKFRQGKMVTPEGDTLKRGYSGSGLGLSIVKEICRMLEGEITLESKLGIGSTFTVHLPWTLEYKNRAESDMMAEIQQFAMNRVSKMPKTE
jgi:signal transduction histidine kinase